MSIDWSKVKVTTDRGGCHRAFVLAEQLYDAGRWDGQTEICFPDPYDAHQRMSLGRTATDLVAGEDYIIGDAAAPETPQVHLDAISIDGQIAQLCSFASYDEATDQWEARRKDGTPRGTG
jgi:hypothetical protein